MSSNLKRSRQAGMSKKKIEGALATSCIHGRHLARPGADSLYTQSSSLSRESLSQYERVPIAFDDAADDDEVAAPVQRLPGVTLELWKSPQGARAREMESEMELNDVEMRRGEDAQDGNRKHGSVLAGGSFRRANSIQVDVDAGAGPSRGPFRRGSHAIPNAANNSSFIGNLNSLKSNIMANANPTPNAPNKNQNGSKFPPAGPVTRAASSPACVPSSVSSSPLRHGVGVSPPKIPDHRTKALHDSIVSLLCKRPATPEDTDALPVGRAGKRGCAQRSKPQSRHPSDVLPVTAPQDSEQQIKSVFGAGRSFSPGVEDSDAGALEGLSMGADEQSLRVMYEDPGQRAELQRLATLIGEPFEVGGETSSKKRPPRRSARRSGY
ncbi:hypothetical protein MSAN_01382600 [Mycena sanguinolenta]|uniref:Uncharacterized protein n=1 Tax=Mycena sanguinolenta TaxID=230812 RepID=A0A8H6Y939_9AGAR|nr:hypothetical protein MSAN_01382600 [Mycena sanguinolenta]